MVLIFPLIRLKGKDDNLSFIIWMILINTSFWLVLNFGLAYGNQLLPKIFFVHNIFFKEFSFERNLYKTLRVSKWKDRVPAVNSTLKKLKVEFNPTYFDKVIMQTYRAEFGHLAIALLGFLCVAVNPTEYFQMAIICSVVNFFFHIPFCIIQRYNRPRLIKMKLRLENK